MMTSQNAFGSVFETGNVGYTEGSAEIMRKEYGYYTKEEIVREFFGLHKIKEVDDKGNVVDVKDDFHNEWVLRKMGVYDYLNYKPILEARWVTEQDMRNFFPYVQFNAPRSEATPETPSEWGLSDISEASEKPKRKRGAKAVEQVG